MDWVERVGVALMGLMGVAFVALLGLGAYAIYDEITSDKFYLRKDEWRCSASHVETTLQTVVSDKSVVLVPVANAVCDEWSRRK